MLAIGNPLLDISTRVDSEFLLKYRLQPNDAILANDSHGELYEELKTREVEYYPGGATQNTARVVNWMLRENVIYAGSVGDDETAEKMRTLMKNEGLKTKYYVSKKRPTGVCAVLVNEDSRSLVANLSAAGDYSFNHVHTLLGDARVSEVVYSSGFFLTVCPEANYRLAEEAKIYATNLAAPFLSQVPEFFQRLEKICKVSDFVFSNDDEMMKFAESSSWESQKTKESLVEAMLKMSKLGKPKIVCCTRGSESTLVVGDGKVYEFEVEKVDEIVDTNGAGDAFVGGFLAQLIYIRRNNLDQQNYASMCAAGHFAAHQILKESGVRLEKKSTWKF